TRRARPAAGAADGHCDRGPGGGGGRARQPVGRGGRRRTRGPWSAERDGGHRGHRATSSGGAGVGRRSASRIATSHGSALAPCRSQPAQGERRPPGPSGPARPGYLEAQTVRPTAVRLAYHLGNDRVTLRCLVLVIRVRSV